MSSFLGAKGVYGINLDLIKSPSSSSVSPSTLSKSSSASSLSIATKRARTPRKRPNQSYMEAATLLSTACPEVFSINNLHRKHSTSLSSLSSSSLSSSEILPPFAVRNESNFLIGAPSHYPNSSYQLRFKAVSTNEKSYGAFRAGSPPKSLDCDVNSIFDDEVDEGVDGIMGKLSMNDWNSNSNSNPFVGSSMRLHVRHALRGAHGDGLWSPMTLVQMKDIVPKSNALPSLEKKKNSKTTKKKKKVEKEVKDEFEVFRISCRTSIATSPCRLDGKLKSGLGLKLNHEEVIKAWGDSGCPISSDTGTQESSAEIAQSKEFKSAQQCKRDEFYLLKGEEARLAKIDMSPDNEGGGMREASIFRYQEKRRTQHFSEKICYQIRKVNADCRPRIKGRFVKRTRSLAEVIKVDDQ